MVGHTRSTSMRSWSVLGRSRRALIALPAISLLLRLAGGSTAGQAPGAAVPGAAAPEAPPRGLPPVLRPRPAPPMEEIAALEGPRVNVRYAKAWLTHVAYGSPELRRWVEPCLQRTFFELPAWARLTDRPGGELLTAAAAAINCVLRPAHGTVAITDCPGLEKWLPLGRELINYDPEARGNAVHFRFSPGQLALLAAGGRIHFSELREDQQNITRHVIWQEYVFTRNVAPEALLLNDVILYLEPENPIIGDDRTVWTYAPTWDVRGMGPVSGVQWKEAQAGPPVTGTHGRPPGGLPPSLTGVVPTCPRMTHPDLRNEKDLAASLPPVRDLSSVGAALTHLTNHAAINLMAVTRMSQRAIEIAPGPLTVRGLMEQIAAEVGGRWGKLGETYVLLLDPRLEREAALRGRSPRFWLERLLAGLIGSIGKRGRDLLWRNNYLRPRQLTSQQKFALETLVRLAIVTERRIDPHRALSLAEARLVYVEGDRGKGAAGLELRDRAGAPLIVAQVPLDPDSR